MHLSFPDEDSNNNIIRRNSSNKNKIPSLINHNSISYPFRYNRLIQPIYQTYTIIRRRKSPISSIYFYTFQNSEGVLFAAKAKHRYPSTPIAIQTNLDVHLNKKPFKYVLVPQNKSLSLFSVESLYLPLMTFKIIQSKLLGSHFEITLNNSNGSNYILKTKEVMKTLNGNAYLDFHEKMVIPSVKNMIFVDRYNLDHEIIIVRKIHSEILECDALSTLTPLQAFSIILSVFVCKI